MIVPAWSILMLLQFLLGLVNADTEVAQIWACPSVTNGFEGALKANAAVDAISAPTYTGHLVTVQLPLPLHSPFQEVKRAFRLDFTAFCKGRRSRQRIMTRVSWAASVCMPYHLKQCWGLTRNYQHPVNVRLQPGNRTEFDSAFDIYVTGKSVSSGTTDATRPPVMEIPILFTIEPLILGVLPPSMIPLVLLLAGGGILLFVLMASRRSSERKGVTRSQ